MKWIESHFPRARVNRSYYRYYYSHYAYAPCPARRACVPVCGGERKEKLCSRRSRRCDSTLNCISILKWYFVFFKVYRLPAWPETGPNATIIVVPTYNTSENRIEKKKNKENARKMFGLCEKLMTHFAVILTAFSFSQPLLLLLICGPHGGTFPSTSIHWAEASAADEA